MEVKSGLYGNSFDVKGYLNAPIVEEQDNGRAKDFRALLDGNDRKLILDFCTAKTAEGKKPARVYKYAKVLASWMQFLEGKHYEGLKIEDMRTGVAALERSVYADTSRVQFKAILKVFFRWVKGCPDYRDPPETEWLKCNCPKPKRYSSKEMLNEEDVSRLISVTTEAKLRAFLAVLWDAGLRIGEISALRTKDVNFEEDGGVTLHVPDDSGCKTGSRDIYVVSCAGYLRQWLDAHSGQDDPEAYLFCNSESRKMMNYTVLLQQLRRLAKAIDLKKRHNFHFFRKSRATSLARAGWSQEQLNAFFGWVPGSGMSAVYIHMTARDTKAPMQRMHGIQPREETVSYARNLRCEQCGAVNVPDTHRCTRCGLQLDLRESEMQKAELGRLEKLLEKLKSKQAEGQSSAPAPPG
jgi:site-specific recombinase XerD/ribosomal protein L40E